MDNHSINKRARYIYLLMEGLPLSVIDSQVIEILSQLSLKGLTFDLMVFTGLKPAWSDRKTNIERLSKLKQQLPHNRIFFIGVPFPGKIFGHIVIILILTLMLIPSIIRNQKIVAHCRGHFSAIIGLKLKRIIPKFHFLFDIRGDMPAEAQYYSDWRGSIESWIKTVYYAKLKKQERACLNKADYIICVSNKHRKQLEKNIKILSIRSM